MLVKRVYSEEERKKKPQQPVLLGAAYVYTVKHTHKLDNGVQVGKAAVTAGCCLGVVSAGAIVRMLAPP